MKNNDSQRRSNMVRVRGGFSDLNGIAPCNTVPQVYEFDDDSRVMMSNALFEVLETLLESPHQFFSYSVAYDLQNKFCKSIVDSLMEELLQLLMSKKSILSSPRV